MTVFSIGPTILPRVPALVFMACTRQLVWLIAVALWASACPSAAIDYVSNLGTRWVDPANPDVNDIGDIHALVGGYAPFVAHFLTGTVSGEVGPAAVGLVSVAPSTNWPVTGFVLNQVTFEFIGGRDQSWSNVTVELYQELGTNRVLLATLCSPSVNPALTQWPEHGDPNFCTTYVDYFALTNIVLQPASEYSFNILPVFSFGMLFAISPAFASLTDWRMGQTLTGDPWAAGEFLKFAVDASAIPSDGSAGAIAAPVPLGVSRQGTNLVLSWSTAACHLYTSPDLAGSAWTLVQVPPETNNGSCRVNLPLSDASRFFRLQYP